MNGFTKNNEKNISNKSKYSILGISSSITWIRTFNTNEEIYKKNFLILNNYKLLVPTVSTAICIGSLYCMGTFMGKTAKEIDLFLN